jgi:hypothetical protein
MSAKQELSLSGAPLVDLCIDCLEFFPSGKHADAQYVFACWTAASIRSFQ